MTERRSAYVDGLYLLGRRELSVAECRSRLADREHDGEEIEAAIARLIDIRVLDDARVARAFARTSFTIKGRGRARIARELQAKGIARDVADAALDEVLGDSDERTLVAKALQKRLRGRTTLKDRAESGRLYQYLMRQGFSSSAVMAELRALRSGGSEDE